MKQRIPSASLRVCAESLRNEQFLLVPSRDQSLLQHKNHSFYVLHDAYKMPAQGRHQGTLVGYTFTLSGSS